MTSVRSKARPLVEEDILVRYDSGEPIRQIASSYHCRQANIREVLKRRGRNPSTLRGARIGATRLGQPLKRTLVAYRNTPNMFGSVAPEEWAYIAGMFDGDGCLNRAPSGHFRVEIAQNGTELHEWLLHTLGVGAMREANGYAYQHNHYHYRIDAQIEVYRFLCGVLPYLVVKREWCTDALHELSQRYSWPLHAHVIAA